MSKVKLQSMDGDVLEVDEESIRQCGSIKDLVSENREEPIQIHNINTAILKKVTEWCNYHKNDPPLPEYMGVGYMYDIDICPWDAEFLKVDDLTLFALIEAAYYLDTKRLMEVSCKTAALKIYEARCQLEDNRAINAIGQTRAENNWYDEW
ncbi:S-phase kinase-associated protein 1-like [Saccostrea cucullata]|uniref:S-phase kinase-associated protein 1-like n=1 Tax=Saccostrea cuccullata TaxID=36930 RepID=UPI002ED00893